jgi:eukaryotic-like serine/threonine-protein kinase
MALDTPLGAAAKLGRYELLKELAKSGLGTTWIARSTDDVDDAPLRSLLRVQKGLVKKAEVAEGLLTEARRAEALHHPNALQLIEAGNVDGEIFLVTEQAEGEVLSSLITAAGPTGLPLPIGLRIALDALGAVAAAHAQGSLCHGEISPQHLLVGVDGVTRVVGFGTARGLARLPLLGAKNGDRLAYAAPERIKSMASPIAAQVALEPRADVFALGVILWEGVTKQRLFSSKIEAAVIQKVLTASIAAPGSIAGVTVPSALDEAILKALERDPARRFQSAGELLAAVEAAAGQVATHAEVAEQVEKLAGKAIAARRNQIGATAARAARPPSVPPPRAPIQTRPSVPDEEGKGAPAAKPVNVKVEAPKPLDAKAEAPKPIEAKPRTPKPGEAISETLKPPQVKVETPKPSPVKAESPKPSAVKVESPKPSPVKVESPKPSAVKVEVPKPAEAKVEVPKPAAKPVVIRKQTLLGMVAPKPDALKSLDASIETLKPAFSKAGPPKPPPARPEFVSAEDLDVGFEVDAEGSEPPPEPAKAAPAKPAPPVPPTPPGKPARAPVAAKADEPAPASVRVEPAPASVRVEPAPAPAITYDTTTAATVITKTGPRSDNKTGGSLTNDTPTSDSVARGKSATAIDKIGPASTLGRYEILTPIARGGMASVWAARLMGTRGFQKLVAVKTMLPDVSDDPDFEQMFLDEARIAARIRHPNVAEILDLGEQDDVLYLVMEWVEGENLSVVLKAARAIGGMPLPVILRIASQACAGLHAAHELRDDNGNLVDLIHRDVSPANVLVSMAGFVKLVDFGVAKSKGRMHVTRAGGMVKGKTPYLSPEQLGGLPLDRRSDIFSFGALLYVMATGLHPFRGETEGKTVENIALKNPVPLRTINAALPVEFEKLVLKALEKDPKNRYSSAAELQRALDQIGLTLPEPANESDVADFVRKVIGEPQAKRAADIKSAIASLDALTSGSGDIPRSDALRILDGGKRSPNSVRSIPEVESAAAAPISAPSAAAMSTPVPTGDEITIDAPPGYSSPEPQAAVERPADEVALDVFGPPAAAAAPASAQASFPIERETVRAPAMPTEIPIIIAEKEKTPSRYDVDEAPPTVRPRTQPKRLQVIVGAVVGVCALIGILAAVLGGSAATGSTQPEATQATATATAAVTAAPTTTAAIEAPAIPTAAVATPPPSATVEAPPTPVPTAAPVAPPPTKTTPAKGRGQGSSVAPSTKSPPIKPGKTPPTKKYNPSGI